MHYATGATKCTGGGAMLCRHWDWIPQLKQQSADQAQGHTHLPLRMRCRAWHMQEGQAAELCVQRGHTAACRSTFCLSRKRRWAVELVSLHKEWGHR